MNEIIPVGILVEDRESSTKFYRQILKIPRVQVISSDASGEFSGSILRLESPHIEVNTTEIKIRDRNSSNFTGVTQRLKLHCKDLQEMKTKLLGERIQTFESEGKLSFLDFNGINWDLTAQDKLAA